MTTETEALRAQFERRMNLRGWSEANIRRDGLDYSSTQITEAWHAFQAGHAAAKAETADVGEPVAFAHFAENGNIRLWAPERPLDLDGNAAQPLYTADQLAAAVAAERDYWRKELHTLLEAADAVATNNAHAVSTGSVRYAKYSQTWEAYASLDKARQRAADAIRAGAKA